MTIKVSKPQDLQALFSKAQRDAKEHGITWVGDIHSGHGSGRGFEGSYAVDTDYITICVNKKPRMVTKSRIEKAITSYISQGDLAYDK